MHNMYDWKVLQYIAEGENLVAINNVGELCQWILYTECAQTNGAWEKEEVERRSIEKG